MYKTAVYTLAKGGIQGLTHQNSKNQKKVILFSSRLTHSQCYAGNITFYDFLLFLMCKSLNAAFSKCVNCCFVHYIIINYLQSRNNTITVVIADYSLP